MLFLRKSSKLMTVVLFLSLALAMVLDASIHSPLSNMTNNGKAMTVATDSGHTEVLEAGFWGDLWETVKKVVAFSYCIIDTSPSSWGEECWPIWQ